MKIYNLMSCQNFDAGFMGGCGMAWMGLVLLFFLGALLRKWGGEEVDMPFNFISCLVIGFLAYIIVISFLGSAKWAMLAGVIGLVGAGYITPYIYEEPTFGGD